LYAFGSNGGDGRSGTGSKGGDYKPIPLNLKLKSQVRRISCGWDHSLLITVDGKLYGTGNNAYG
jgi:alpha-tubulin suppressor-like RCC1 family protein